MSDWDLSIEALPDNRGRWSKRVVATIEGQVVGTLEYGSLWEADEDDGTVGFGPVEVDPAYRRRGLATAMLDHVIEIEDPTALSALWDDDGASWGDTLHDRYDLPWVFGMRSALKTEDPPTLRGNSYYAPSTWRHWFLDELRGTHFAALMEDADQGRTQEQWVRLEDLWIFETDKSSLHVDGLDYWDNYQVAEPDDSPWSAPQRDPVYVFRTQRFGDDVFLLDGHHRVFKAILQGIGSIRADVLDRTYEEVMADIGYVPNWGKAEDDSWMDNFDLESMVP